MNTAYEITQSRDLIEDEIRLGMSLDAPAELSPVTFPPRAQSAMSTATPVQAAHAVPPAPRSRALHRLLAMADSYLREGSIRQALEMYYDMMNRHPETAEALQAEERILEVARLHEEAGEFHNARAIYDQMV
jgi:pentatricopeptide repeat protein